MALVYTLVDFFYQLYQTVIAYIFAPPPPSKPLGNANRIAIVGAGLTGVSSAAHVVGHGFEATIFEAGGRENLGGIWSRVNNTSSLQIYSIMYRFHPSVKFRAKYPDRARIVEEITKVWKLYRLEERTVFNVKVESVWKDGKSGKWVVNDASYGLFDGVIAAVGTCGRPKMLKLPDQEKFHGDVCHSSELTGKDLRDKEVLVIGGGASAVEAIEYAVHQKAKSAKVLARTQKWMIPRSPIVDGLLAMNITGEETNLSWIPEFLLKRLYYRDLADLAPTKVGLFTETPICNDDILRQLRSGQAEWLIGDVHCFSDDGIIFNERDANVPKGGPGREILVKGDVAIVATGFHRPSLHFLPEESFTAPFQPPNWYLQTFPIGQPDVCATNCTFIGAIGTVGNMHIGIYTRYLLMFVADPATRPTAAGMRMWVDSSRAIKSSMPGHGLEFFTYSELIWWFVVGMILNPIRWKWIFFVLFGWGYVCPPATGGNKDPRNGQSTNYGMMELTQ